MGPQGTGGLCVRKGLAVKPLLSGGSGILTFEKQHPSVMPTALEAGTLNGHGIAGLRAALLYIKEEGIEAIGAREQKLMQLFYEQVKEIPDIRIYGDFSQKDRAAIVSLNLGEEESGEVSDYLSTEYGNRYPFRRSLCAFNAWGFRHCGSGGCAFQFFSF